MQQQFIEIEFNGNARVLLRVATPYEYVPLLARVIAQLVNDARIRNAM